MSEINKEGTNRAAVSDELAAQVTGGEADVPSWVNEIKTNTNAAGQSDNKDILTAG